MTSFFVDPVRPLFRSLATSVVPEMKNLGEREWTEVERLIEEALAARPESMRLQLGLFLSLLKWLPVLRYGRTFHGLDEERRTRFLRSMQDSPLLLFRRGFWGFRTLVFLGYYGRPEVAAAIGYRPDRRGWDARR